MGRSAGKCRPFPFVEPNVWLMVGTAFRELPGDSEAFRGVVVTFWSHWLMATRCRAGFDQEGAAPVRRLRQS
jgi:hypothetical protein